MLAAVLLSGFVLRADAPVEGRAGRAELRFLEGMIDHHQMALDMAADCLEKASSADLKTICENVIAAQSAEITMMQEWLLAWYNVQYAPLSMTEMHAEGESSTDHGGHGGHGAHGSTPHSDPPMMMGMMAGLNRVEGQAYDAAWLESMIDHHDDAIHMAQRLLGRVPADAGHSELLELAARIISDQSAEIEQMEVLLTQFGS
jgi:uncharacterized protein (DUF305 family)